ncbi:hypothetical protein [Actinosynnema sp. NPDC023587]|uniref:hypothetical protein n=1 Tax=Actinosynnema sp. NPDC023587 TaxID=3154695 RepID=UPI0033E4593E
MTEPDEADLVRTRQLIDEAKVIAEDLRETTPDPSPAADPVTVAESNPGTVAAVDAEPEPDADAEPER